MLSFHIYYIVLGIWVVLCSSQSSDTTFYSHIYTNLDNWPCVRLLNATSTLGCQAPSTGSGILYQIDTQNDIDSFVSKLSLDDSFALVMPYGLLTPENIQQLEATRRVTGIFALLQQAAPQPNNLTFTSPDAACPNCDFGLYADDPDAFTWNPNANGLLHQAFNIPIYAINPIDKLSKQVYNTFESALDYNKQRNFKEYPLQAVDFKLLMWAAMDSSTCLRRGWCQPVGGMSVFSTPSRSITADDNKPIIVLAAGLDSRSLFHDLTMGIDTSISGLVTVLAVADALRRAPLDPARLDKHILYTLFTAEAWGFAGSQRFVQDISQPFVCTNASRFSPCPYLNAPCTHPCVQDLNFKKINLNNIDTIIEMGSFHDAGDIWAHVDTKTNSESLVKVLQSYSNDNANVNVSSPRIQAAYSDGIQRGLPPSSSMSFLKQKRSTKTVVLTGYQKEMNSYYNSDMDDQLNLDQLTRKICGLVNVTARTVYDQAQTSTSPSTSSSLPSASPAIIDLIAANCTLVQELLDCLVSNFSCDYMQNYFNISGVDRISHYPLVYSFSNPQPQYIPRFVFSYLSGITGTSRLDDQGQAVKCNRIQDCQTGEYCIKQQCVTTLTSYHPAYGTGLSFDETTAKVSVIDKTKGTYTESTWDTPSLRLFLVSSRKQQHVELVIGILWMTVSILTVIFAKRYAKLRFKLD